MTRRRLLLAALVGVLAALPALADAAPANDYSNPDYVAYDVDNMARTTQRQAAELTSLEYGMASMSTFSSTFLEGIARQASDAEDVRLYATLGQALPGGNVGDPERYDEGTRAEVELLNREGTKLVGNVWPCTKRTSAGGQARCPGVVITTGSIQVTQHMYGWLARLLQANGYTVMTYDVRGQGESETTTHAPGTSGPGVASPQDGANFVNGTVDALRFLLSTPAKPYVPVGWTAADRAAANALVNADDLEWVNPFSEALDPTRLALVGHSLGASAVSTVQQCSNANPARAVADSALPAGCAKQRFPIRAVIAYDSLSSSVIPVVPAFDHRADGYFVNAQPTTAAPDPDERTNAESPYGVWRAAGVQACSITVRGGTHAEWSEIPYIIGATQYGLLQSAHYSLGFLDRYVPSSVTVNTRGFDRLRTGPIPKEAAGEHLPQRASLMSGKYRSACAVSSPTGSAPFVSSDLRAYAKVAPVGAWAALNTEREGL